MIKPGQIYRGINKKHILICLDEVTGELINIKLPAFKLGRVRGKDLERWLSSSTLVTLIADLGEKE